MSQNITLMGASYSAVPAVLLPKTGGGTARFDDASITTATASDVASGKKFLASDGTITTGTASGGGGASNIVIGKFTAGSTGAAHSVTIPYTGNGYPIAAMVFPSTGAYKSGSDWYTSYQKYTIAQWTFSKSDQSSTPTYTTSGAANQGVTTWIYKNSSSTNYSRSSAMNTNVLSSSNATGAGATCCRFKSKTELSYYSASTSYGLLSGEEYKYIVVYSG